MAFFAKSKRCIIISYIVSIKPILEPGVGKYK